MVFSVIVLLAWRLTCLRGRAVRDVLLAGGVAIFLLMAWSLRNHAVFGRFVFVSTNSGVNLLLGNCENTTPASGPSTNIRHYLDQAEGLNEADRDIFLRNEALAYMRRHKRRTLESYIAKVAHYFHYRERFKTTSEWSTAREWLLLLSYPPLLLLFMVRVAMARRFKPSREELLLWLLYVLPAFFLGVFFTRIRLRIPQDYLLAGLVAMFVARLRENRRAHIAARGSAEQLP
jgi:hypothetical protein